MKDHERSTEFLELPPFAGFGADRRPRRHRAPLRYEPFVGERPHSRPHRLIQRLKDSRIAQWSLAYLAFAFGSVELLGNLSDIWGWSVAFQRTAVLILACGLPPVLVLSWYHGEKGRQKVCATEAVILTVLLLLALVVVRVSTAAV